MAALVTCPACEFGRHDQHVVVWEAVPEGYFGGKICPCIGECRKVD